jgi:hypothetical protein
VKGLQVSSVHAERSDVDFEAGTLSVRQAIERSGGDRAARRPLVASRREIRTQIAGAPKRSAERRQLREQLEGLRVEWRKVRTVLRTTELKSARSRRTIHMPAIVVTALKGHRTRQLEERLAAGGAWKENGLVFTSLIGTALDSRNVSREFHVLLKAAACRPSVFTICGTRRRRCCSRKASTLEPSWRRSGTRRSA